MNVIKDMRWLNKSVNVFAWLTIQLPPRHLQEIPQPPARNAARFMHKTEHQDEVIFWKDKYGN